MNNLEKQKNIINSIKKELEFVIIEGEDLANPLVLQTVKNLFDNYNKEINEYLGHSISSNPKSRSFWIKNVLHDSLEHNQLISSLKEKMKKSGLTLLSTCRVKDQNGKIIEYDYLKEEFYISRKI